MQTPPRIWIVVLVAALVSGAVVANTLIGYGGDATAFIGFGEEAAATRAYAEEQLHDVVLREKQGHDGKFFFVQANDPWLLKPAEHAALLEPPVYRSQRMLYPVLAGVMGVLGPEAIVWSLVVVNIIGMVLGTIGTARLARLLGGSEWWGLAFVLNFGLLFDLQNDGAGIVAACLAIWGVLMLYRRQYWWAIALFGGAVLAREVMLITSVGAAAWHWFDGRRQKALATAAIPLFSLAVWIAYVTARIGPDQTSVGAFSAPFVGLVKSFQGWLEDPVNLAIGISMLLLMIIYTMRWWTSRTALGWSYVGFVAVALVMSERVWSQPFDFARALAPLLSAAILLVFVELSSQTHSRETDLAVSTRARASD